MAKRPDERVQRAAETGLGVRHLKIDAGEPEMHGEGNSLVEDVAPGEGSRVIR